MIENPWSREHFDLDRQEELVHRGDCKQINGLLIDAGWCPQEAHGFIIQMLRARAVAERMEAMTNGSKSLEGAQRNARDALREAEEVRKRAEALAAKYGVRVARSRHSEVLLAFAIGLAVMVLGVWLTA